jgi:Flagellar hook protein FlgE
MLPSFYNAVSGLDAFNNYLSIVSNNMANADTVGYKAINPIFENVIANVNVGINTLTDTLKSTVYGAGVIVDSTQIDWQLGNFEQTGNNTDLAIQGNGLFILQDPANAGNIFYTRNGQFTISQQGYMVNPDGLKLLGYKVDQSGSVVGASLQPIYIIPQQPPKATDLITYQQPTNLNSTAPSITQAFNPLNTATFNYQNTLTTFDSLGNTVEGDAYFQKTGPNTWNYIYAENEKAAYYSDTSGRVLYRNVAGTWQSTTISGGSLTWYNITNPPNTASSSIISATVSPYYMISGTNSSGSMVTDWVVDVTTSSTTISYVVNPTKPAGGTQEWDTIGSAAANGFVPYNLSSGIGVPIYTGSSTIYAATALLNFDPNTGNITTSSTIGVYIYPTSSSYEYFIGTQNPLVLGDGNIVGNLNSASSQSTGGLAFGQLIGSKPTTSISAGIIDNSYITQDASDFTITASQDGYSLGNLVNVYVLSSDGTVVGVYSNGQSTPLYRVALAQFQDPNELIEKGSNLYTSIYTPTILLPGSADIIQSGMLEQSNVDIAQAYIQLVTAERSYQANAKVVTSSDNVLQSTLNMVTG